MSTTQLVSSLEGGDRTQPGYSGEGHHELSFIRKYVFSTDHKTIGKQFLFLSLFLKLLLCIRI